MDHDAAATGAAEVREFVVAPAQHLIRLDKVLADFVPEFSRSYLQQLQAAGAVELNGRQAVKPAAKVAAGDRLRVEMRPTQQSQAFKAENLPIDVVYEDEHLLVVHKPAGLVVHPAAGNWSGTLLNALLGRDEQARALPRAGIVHRLDKDTSGLMVVARSRQTMDALVRMIAAREVSRQYLAIAHRPWVGARERHVNAPMGRDPRNRLRMAVVDLDRNPGKTAQTDISVLDSVDEGCLVRCTLHTGRTHQIRVHMASIHHPLLADVLYGGSVVGAMNRQALHAFRLAFTHPVSGEELVFHAALPQDMQGALDQWGLRYNAGMLSTPG
ncbi:RluA family pseudouridine synthase [Diaphorobacter aerolatus]|uniref:RluA family pseudouridine synthase n=1 Tax=Diaphorobacter aerolatus TaxID=1288495 RepID=UPI001D0082D6|nr:RluA family pseudouridine synthase [Diaphorobacter aerolatus]